MSTSLSVVPVYSSLMTSLRFIFLSLSLGIYWRPRDSLRLGRAMVMSKLAAQLLECVVRFSLRACTSNTATLSLLAAVIINAVFAPFLNVKALCANFPLPMDIRFGR